MNEAKEKTALCTSVGADERQSVQNTISSIQSLLAPETGTDAQRVYLFRGCAGDSRKAA